MIFVQQNTKDFPFEAAKALYEENREYLFHDLDFDTLYKKTNGNLWAIVDKELIAIVYFHFIDGKWFFNGFTKRKKYKYVKKIITQMCEKYFKRWNITEIYSKTPYRHAKFALLRAGFKQISSDIYRKEKDNG